MQGIINEALLQYLWKVKKIDVSDLYTTCGNSIQIIDFGVINHEDGPDFLNCRIFYRGIYWHGHIEIHLRSSDWYRHGHHSDIKYQNVILHVVLHHDRNVVLDDGYVLPTIEINHRIQRDFVLNFSRLKCAQQWIPCAALIHHVRTLVILSAKSRAVVERLERKSISLFNELEKLQGNIHELMYRSLACSFGLNKNKTAFYKLACELPFTTLRKHAKNLLQTEALLFGCAGILPNKHCDPYVSGLIKEFSFLKTKYGLQEIDPILWKTGRSRPAASIFKRIAQWAKLIVQTPKIDQLFYIPDLHELRKNLEVQLRDFWSNHYSFTRQDPSAVSFLGKERINIIIINSIVPVLYFLGDYKHEPDLKEKAMMLLERISPEKNNITRNWAKIGVSIDSAWDSQALIELKTQDCSHFRCLSCQIGHEILSGNNNNR